MKRWTIVCSLSLLSISGALAIPETVVFMPTANLGTPRSVYLATEQYGVPRYYSQTRTRCLYTQLMVTERFDFGVDFVGLDNNQSRQTLGNARFVLSPESKRSPGFAVGALNITDNANPTFYLVGTQTVSFGRFHLGAYRQGEQHGLERRVPDHAAVRTGCRAGVLPLPRRQRLHQHWRGLQGEPDGVPLHLLFAPPRR
jgi:hypothetical protein